MRQERRGWPAKPRLSGSIFVDLAHGMDSSAFRAFGRVRDTEGNHAMLHQNTVFHSVLKHLPWHKLEQSVEKHGADKLSRTLTTKRHLLGLLYGQLSAACFDNGKWLFGERSKLPHIEAGETLNTFFWSDP
jgi:Domain of unknown function (DUF4372)